MIKNKKKLIKIAARALLLFTCAFALVQRSN